MDWLSETEKIYRPDKTLLSTHINVNRMARVLRELAELIMVPDNIWAKMSDDAKDLCVASQDESGD